MREPHRAVQRRFHGLRILLGFCVLLGVANIALAANPDDPPYQSEEIRFTSGRFTIVGSLLTPLSPAPHPAIVYVWGSGPTDIKKHIERSQMLERFLARGFAVLLYDKPGSGQSTGELDSRRLFAELAGILINATTLLKRHPGIDPRAIGLYGSSQASYVMAVALARTRDIAFAIAWSCPMQNSIEQSAYLVRNYVLCAGGTDALADSAQQAYRQRGQARSYADYRAAADILDNIPAIRDGLGWAGVEPEGEFIPPDSTSERFLDPSVMVASLEIPVLALFAENDRQIDPIQGAAAYRRILAGASQKLSSVETIPGADHNMNLSPRGCMQDQRDGYRSVGGAVMSPKFLETVDEWLGRLKADLSRP